MDSGNSGSLQSSSGGDEEYDSRAAADSVSAFMSGGQISSNPPPPFFDPLSNYLHLHQNPNPNPNPNPLLNCWPRISATTPLRSDPNPNQNPRDVIINSNSNILHNSSPFMPPFQPPPSPAVAQPPPPPPPPNPKKRSRASRRAPTTVLTTDTTNFRAMVQEFTGIPNPPFNNSVFPRTRFASRSTTLDPVQPPPYLRRPFPQKFQPPSSTPSTTSSSSSPLINYQQQPPTQSSSNLFNNPLFSSFLQTNPKFPPVMTSKPLQGSFDITKSIGGLDDQLFLSDQTLTSHHTGLFASDHHQKQPNNSNSEVNLTDFARNATTENVAGRGEGMVESWICSSD